MSRIIILLLALITLAGCCEKPAGTESSVSSQSDISSDVSSGLPEYIPGSIKLSGSREGYGNEYRGIYYTVDGFYTAKYLDNDDDDMIYGFHNLLYNDDYDTMWYVKFVKFFDVPKDDFIEITED